MVAARNAKFADHEQSRTKQNTGQIRFDEEGSDCRRMDSKEKGRTDGWFKSWMSHGKWKKRL